MLIPKLEVIPYGNSRSIMKPGSSGIRTLDNAGIWMQRRIWRKRCNGIE